MTQPPKLREYTYLVGRVPITAMLTEEQAKRMNAELVDSEETQELETPQPDAVDKSRRTRPKKG